MTKHRHKTLLRWSGRLGPLLPLGAEFSRRHQFDARVDGDPHRRIENRPPGRYAVAPRASTATPARGMAASEQDEGGAGNEIGGDEARIAGPLAAINLSNEGSLAVTYGQPIPQVRERNRPGWYIFLS